MVQDKLVLFLCLLEWVESNGFEIGVAHWFPSFADLPHEFLVCRRCRSICLPLDGFFELTISERLISIFLQNANDRLLRFLCSMNEILTQDWSLGDRDNFLRLEDAGIVGHVKHFACHVVVLIRLRFPLVGKYIACFSRGWVDRSSDHVLGRRWSNQPQTLEIACHRGNRGTSHAFTSLRPLFRPLRAHCPIVSIENRTQFLNSSHISNAFSSGEKSICVRLIMARD